MPTDTTRRHNNAQIGCSSYIQRINNLKLEACAKFQVLARHKEDIKTTKLNNFKTSLTNIKHRKYKILADIRAQNTEEIINVISKAKALQDTSRTQQCNTGEPSTQNRNLDTALPTIRPDLVTPEEHHDTVEEDHGQKETTEKSKHTQPETSTICAIHKIILEAHLEKV